LGYKLVKPRNGIGSEKDPSKEKKKPKSRTKKQFLKRGRARVTSKKERRFSIGGARDKWSRRVPKRLRNLTKN